MSSRSSRRVALGAVVAGCAALLPGQAFAAAPAGAGAPSLSVASVVESVVAQAAQTSPYYVPKADPGAVAQIRSLRRHHHELDAARLTTMVNTPQAVWLTGGTPAQVAKQVRGVVRDAAVKHRIPVLVAYNLPFRDCAQYSGGGATNTAAYLAWIKGVAAGIGKDPAVVLVEPDGLGIIPFYQPLYGSMDWCQPKGTDGKPAPGATPTDRFAALNGAVKALAALPRTDFYLDGTNSAWLGPGEITNRLLKAGVQGSDGFFLNVSNYRTTEESNIYGTWVSDCLTSVTAGADWARNHPEWCPGQYGSAGVDYSAAHVADVNKQYVGMLGTAKPTTRYLVDTSRNGRGPNDMAAYGRAPYNQPASVVAALKAANWCNAPGAGNGLRPTNKTGVPLAAAYLWVKTPGQSDGSCDIAGGGRAWDFTKYNPWKVPVSKQNHFDPLWHMVDPIAGAWFPAQALQLATRAVPPTRIR